MPAIEEDPPPVHPVIDIKLSPKNNIIRYFFNIFIYFNDTYI